MSTKIAKVHLHGQAVTILCKKYNIPDEVENMIQDMVFSNRLPTSPLISTREWLCKYSTAQPGCMKDWMNLYKVVLKRHINIKDQVWFDGRAVDFGFINIHGVLIKVFKNHKTYYSPHTGCPNRYAGKSRCDIVGKTCYDLTGRPYTVKELKEILKKLSEYNNMKIPISKLNKKEVISLLIHTEF